MGADAERVAAANSIWCCSVKLFFEISFWS